MLVDRWVCSAARLQRWRTVGEGPQYLKIEGKVLYWVRDIEVLGVDGSQAVLTAFVDEDDVVAECWGDWHMSRDCVRHPTPGKRFVTGATASSIISPSAASW